MNKLRTEYRRYQVSGGMPKAVVALLENKGIGEVESTLQGILGLRRDRRFQGVCM